MRTIKWMAVLFLFGCSTFDKSKNAIELKSVKNDSASNKITPEKIVFHKLDKLFITGNFDGDGIKDTIYQHNFSKLLSSEIDSSPDCFENDLDTVRNWFNNQQPDIFIAFNKRNHDTLHLGSGQGLYCLLNIGDNNLDGRDEIAFVTDYLDYSQTNECLIYSYCNNKWTFLKEFGIHEEAFYFTGEQMPSFKNINGFLEKRNGKWFYKDYRNNFDSIGVAKMERLQLDRCN